MNEWMKRCVVVMLFADYFLMSRMCVGRVSAQRGRPMARSGSPSWHATAVSAARRRARSPTAPALADRPGAVSTGIVRNGPNEPDRANDGNRRPVPPLVDPRGNPRSDRHRRRNPDRAALLFAVALELVEQRADLG